jgi:hypothetical protein
MSTLTIYEAERKRFEATIERGFYDGALNMKKWGLRIMLALLTFTLGLCVAAIVRFRLAPMVKVESAKVGASIKAQLPPLTLDEVNGHISRIAEDAQPTDEVMKPHPVSISPYEIKLLVNQNNKSARQRKGYELDFESIWNQLDIKPDVYTNFDHADISTFQLDNKLDEETVLRLYTDMGWQSIYLIFKKSAAHSKVSGRSILLGYINAFTWIDNPQIRVVSIGANRWVVVRHCAGHGSGGYYREDDDWYEVSDNGVIPVLSYYDFLSGGMNPRVERDTQILKLGFINGVATVVLRVSNTYEGYTEHDDSIPLWKDRRKVTFIRHFGASKFVLDRHNSEISDEELCDLSDSDELCGSVDYSTTYFLQYNYPELVKIVVRGNGKQKEWLRNFLKDCDDSVEKQALQKALEGAQP